MGVIVFDGGDVNMDNVCRSVGCGDNRAEEASKGQARPKENIAIEQTFSFVAQGLVDEHQILQSVLVDIAEDFRPEFEG